MINIGEEAVKKEGNKQHSYLEIHEKNTSNLGLSQTS
jgi:hypothetical protein